MSDTIDKLAISILSDIQQHTSLNLETIDAGVDSEAVRLAGLNLSFDAFLGPHLKYRAFSKLSFKAEHDNIDYSAVADRLEDITSINEQLTSRYSINTLTKLQVSELLARIHYRGSFRNPLQSFTNQRSLGAYYTPPEVADYIVKRTVKPILDERVKNNGGLDLEILKDLRILDPACGPGVFLISAFRFIEHYFQSSGVNNLDRGKLSRCFYGVDLDAGALEIARVSLSLLHDSHGQHFEIDAYKSRLKQGNSLIGLRHSKSAEYFVDVHTRYPFEWKSEFPTAFSGSSKGFDIILFNPPYKSLKPNLAEYIRANLIDGTREIHLEKYESYKESLIEDISYFRNSGEYEFSNKYTINTYRLFIERSLQLLRDEGRVGFIVPSTLLGDLSALSLRKEILSSYQWHFLNEFPEGAKIFPDVTQSLCISSIGKGGPTKEILVKFGLGSIDEPRGTTESGLLVNDIRDVMGSSLQIPRLEQRDWKTLRLLHTHNSLRSIPWLKNHRGEFDLTLDREFISSHGTHSLIRGAHIGRYLLRTRKHEYETIDVDNFLRARKGSQRTKHINLPRIACQQISNQSQRWRVKFSMIEPGTVLANSCNYIIIGNDIDSSVYPYLLGLLNSEVLNWRFSVSSTNNHISNRELGSLPIPDPFENSEDAEIIGRSVRSLKQPSSTIVPQIEARVAKLYKISSPVVKRILQARGASIQEIKSVKEVMN
ncbi:MAG: Eco57I restriction-modification methylase domain-containing protein [Candidatus Thorarchaeota archaeon]